MAHNGITKFYFGKIACLPAGLAAEDFKRAADLIELWWSGVRRSCFQSPTWVAWVKALSEEQVIVQ